MLRYLVLLILLGVGCGGNLQAITIVNRSPRPVEELYVFRQGSTDHGASRGTLAPNASTVVKVKAGNVEVLAVSAKYQLDEHTRDRPTASTALELKSPTEVVFYDEDAPPAGLERKGTVGVAFSRLANKNTGPQKSDEPTVEPASPTE